MKKLFSLLAAVLMAGSMMADSYTITFRDSLGLSGTDGVEVKTLSRLCKAGAEYASAAELSKVYVGREGLGVKIGSGSATGSIKLTLATPVKADLIVVRAGSYGASEGTLLIQGTEFDATNGGKDNKKVTPFAIAYDGKTEVSEITIATKTKRAYIVDVTVYYTPGTTPTAKYYMKHAWDGKNWSWKEMISDSKLGYVGYYVNNNWYGDGVNVSPTGSDSDSKWKPAAGIQFITTDTITNEYVAAPGEPAIGTWATFIYSSLLDTVLVWYETVAAPVTTPAYFVAGNGGDDATGAWCNGINWNPGAEANGMVNGTITYNNVPAGTWEFKVTDGTWNNAWGYSDVDAATSTAGYENNGGNVKFTINAAADITISFNGEKITLTSTVPFGAAAITSYTVVGETALLGANWDVNAEANNMVKGEGNIWTLTKENIALAVNTYNWKVVGNHSYSVFQTPESGNNTLEITEAGNYNVTFTLDAEAKTATVKAEAVVEPEIKTYSAAELIAAYEAGNVKDSDFVYVRGVVSKMQLKPNNFVKYGSVNMWVGASVEDGTDATATVEFYNCYSLQKDTFTYFGPNFTTSGNSNLYVDTVADANVTIAKGDTVTAYGRVILYGGKTLELTSVKINNQYVDYPYLTEVSPFVAPYVVMAANFEDYDLTGMVNSLADATLKEGDNEWASGEYVFNTYKTSYGANAWIVSKDTATTFAGYEDAYRVATGKAAEGSNYAVFYDNSWYGGNYFRPGMATTISGAAITNSVYAVNSILNGDSYAKKFAQDDYFKVIFTGYNAGVKTGEVEFLLADYTGEDWKIAKNWIWADFTALGTVDSVAIAFASSDNGDWGMNTPAYFAIDNIGGDKADCVLGDYTIVEKPAPYVWYIVGAGEAFGNWTPANAIATDNNGSYTFTGLAAGKYEFKVLPTNAGWDGALGFNKLNAASSANVQGEGDGNIIVDLISGDLTITVAADTTVIVTGNFAAPVVADYFIKHPFDGSTWTYVPMADTTIMTVKAYYYVGAYNTGGFNIATSASGANEAWYDDTKINFVDETLNKVDAPAFGTTVLFGFVPAAAGSTMGAAYVIVPTVTGNVNTTVANKASKVLENGKVVIIKNGVRYNVMGVKF